MPKGKGKEGMHEVGEDIEQHGGEGEHGNSERACATLNLGGCGSLTEKIQREIETKAITAPTNRKQWPNYAGRTAFDIDEK